MEGSLLVVVDSLNDSLMNLYINRYIQILKIDESLIAVPRNAKE